MPSEDHTARTLHDPDEPDSDREMDWFEKYIGLPIVTLFVLMMFAPEYLLLAVLVGLVVATLLFYPGKAADILSSLLTDLASALPALEAINFYQLAYHAAFIATVGIVAGVALIGMMWRLADEDEWERLKKFDIGDSDDE